MVAITFAVPGFYILEILQYQLAKVKCLILGIAICVYMPTDSSNYSITI